MFKLGASLGQMLQNQIGGLVEFDIQYESRGPIKGQVYADFVRELASEGPNSGSGDFQWVLSVDGSSNLQGSGAGVTLKEAFTRFELVHVPREQNSRPELLTKLMSSNKGNRQRSVIQETLRLPRMAQGDLPRGNRV